MTTSNRIAWIDTVKAFSIVSVVLFHTHICYPAKTIAYLLCMPAFFFVAGLFTNTRLSPYEFFNKKTLRLLIPYFIFGILSWLAWLIIGRKYGNALELDPWWTPLVGLLSGKYELLIQNKPLWFICCMVTIEWLYYLIRRIQKQWLRWLVIACGTLIGYCGKYVINYNIWEIFAALIMLPIYAISAEFKDAIWAFIGRCRTYILFIIFMCAVAGVWIGYIFNPNIDIGLCELSNPFLFYLTAFSVVGLWLSLALLMDRWGVQSRILQFLGQNTMVILCAHIPLFGFIKGLGLICHVPLSFFETNIGSLILWLGALLLLWPFIYLINRYVPFVAGKTTRK